MPKSWDSDPPGSEARIVDNVRSLIPQIAADVRARPQPTVARAQQWHRQLYDGIPLPEPYFAGEFRGDPRFSELADYEVGVAGVSAVRAEDVSAELALLEGRIQQVCEALDAAIPIGTRPRDEQTLAAIINACAYIHGEWVRIHPFANGNGRTARLWANWIALRYGLPAFVLVKPRPDHQLYVEAGAASMRGDHSLCVLLFEQMVKERLKS